MSTSSCRPQRLLDFATVATEISNQLTGRAGQLEDALQTYVDLLSLPWVVSPSRMWRAESAEREHGEGDDGFL